MMAFDRISPFGDERGDIRLAFIAAKILNTHYRKDHFKTEDFMPFLKKNSARDLWQQIREGLKDK